MPKYKDSMKPLYKVLFLISSAIFLLISCCQKVAHRQPVGIIKLTEDNSGKTLVLSKNQQLTLTLSNKVDGGYRFDKERYDTSVLKLNKHIANPPAANATLGHPGQDVWQFTALKKGTTNLTITASRPWEHKDSVTVFSIKLVIK